jgi:hypothetical protein
MGGGSSRQEQQQVYTDRRAVLGEGALQASDNGTINYQVLDNGAIQRSFDSADKSLAGALNFGTQALDTSSQALAKAFQFGGDTVDQALSSNQEAVAKALQFGGNSLDGALGFGNEALSFLKTTTASALDNVQATQKLTADAYNDAKGRGAMTDKLLIAAIAGMGLVAFAAVHKGKL